MLAVVVVALVVAAGVTAVVVVETCGTAVVVFTGGVCSLQSGNTTVSFILLNKLDFKQIGHTASPHANHGCPLSLGAWRPGKEIHACSCNC